MPSPDRIDGHDAENVSPFPLSPKMKAQIAKADICRAIEAVDPNLVDRDQIAKEMLGEGWSLTEIKDPEWDVFHSTVALSKDGSKKGTVLYDSDRNETLIHSIAVWKNRNPQFFEAA